MSEAPKIKCDAPHCGEEKLQEAIEGQRWWAIYITPNEYRLTPWKNAAFHPPPDAHACGDKHAAELLSLWMSGRLDWREAENDKWQKNHGSVERWPK